MLNSAIAQLFDAAIGLPLHLPLNICLTTLTKRPGRAR